MLAVLNCVDWLDVRQDYNDYQAFERLNKDKITTNEKTNNKHDENASAVSLKVNSAIKNENENENEKEIKEDNNIALVSNDKQDLTFERMNFIVSVSGDNSMKILKFVQNETELKEMCKDDSKDRSDSCKDNENKKQETGNKKDVEMKIDNDIDDDIFAPRWGSLLSVDECHDSDINWVDFGPRVGFGKYLIATASDDMSVKIWLFDAKLKKNELIKEFEEEMQLRRQLNDSQMNAINLNLNANSNVQGNNNSNNTQNSTQSSTMSDVNDAIINEVD